MRGWRPSRFAPVSELMEDLEGIKEENMSRYELRARRGVPLFEPPLPQQIAVPEVDEDLD